MDGKDVMSEISQVINNYPNNFESVKAAKKSFLDSYINNHPHRLNFFKYTGTIHYEFDSRIKEENLFAIYSVTDINLSDSNYYTRVYHEGIPVIERSRPNTGEFIPTQEIGTFWRFAIEIGTEPTQVKVGEVITKTYTRSDPEDEWVERSSNTTNIMMSYRPNFLYGGGDPISGGKGADNQENSVSMQGDFQVSAYVPNPVIYRLPWEDPWENESALFSDSLTDYIAARNAIDPGCWSGSTTMALEFS